MLFSKHFVYNNVPSLQFGLFFGHIDTERFKRLCGEFKYNTQYYNSQNKNVIYDIDKDDSALSFDVEIISETPIVHLQARQIKKWLFNNSEYHKLYSDRTEDRTFEIVNGEEKRLYVECIFSNPEELRYADGLHGWKCTCQLSSGFAFQDKIERTYTDFSSDITVKVDSDYDDYLYPVLVIDVNESSNPTDVTIINKSDNNRIMKLQDVTMGTKIYADCADCIVTDDSNISLYEKLSERKFLRLVNGDNVLSISGASKLNISWQNLRWLR